MPCSAPVVLFIFRRPEVTARVFEAIRAAQPTKLFVVADGPAVAEERSLCEATRAVVSQIDWPCDTYRQYATENLGCRQRIVSGLDWVFSQVDRAIILEDDCLPDSSFFRYCDELLDRYKDDTRIMHIGGNNFLCADPSRPYSYYFSGFSHVWGWATWRRAWQLYDAEMTKWPMARDEYASIFERFQTKWAIAKRKAIWGRAYRGKVNTWDFQWTFAISSQSGLCILPKHNLVSNIGIGKGAVHTVYYDSRRHNLPTTEMPFPMKHPELVLRDDRADLTYLNKVASKTGLVKRGANKARFFFRNYLGSNS